jgi:ribosomal protein S18 acetylase RimI-like enzyme
MDETVKTKPGKPDSRVERVNTALSRVDLNDLCDAADAAIEGGGGFGWLKIPERDSMERFWNGVVTMPARILFVARLDGVICGSCQLLKPAINNEAQRHTVQLNTNFVAPWARGHGLAKLLIETAEAEALKEGFSVINLDVRETMERAISLYESLGYTRVGTHPYYARVDNKVVKGYYYYKVIDPKAVEQKR